MDAPPREKPVTLEFSPKAIRTERLLAAAFLAFLSAILWRENCSELSCALRANEPWLCWLSLKGAVTKTTDLHLLLYQPASRTLDLLTINQPRRQAEELIRSELPLAHRGPALPLLSQTAALPENIEAPLLARQWLLDKTQGLGFWRELARAAKNAADPESTLANFDRFLLACELHRLNPKRLRPAWLALAERDRRALLGRLLTPNKQAGQQRFLTIEVLSASSTPGVASQATKLLRSKGLDVVNFGNLSGARAHTVVYDRAGRIEDAEMVRGMLACPQANTVTQISPRKLVDVSVILADDCAPRHQKGEPWNSQRF